jgi:hypothetical protein
MWRRLMKIVYREKIIYLTLLFLLGAYLWPYVNYCLAAHVSFFGKKNLEFFSGTYLYLLGTFPILAWSVFKLKKWSPGFLFLVAFVIFIQVFFIVWPADNKILVLINGVFLYLSFSQSLYLHMELNMSCYPSLKKFASEWNFCNKQLNATLTLTNDEKVAVKVLEWDQTSLLIRVAENFDWKQVSKVKSLSIDWIRRNFIVDVVPVIQSVDTFLIGVKVIPSDNSSSGTESKSNGHLYEEFYELSMEFAYGENKL